MHRRVIMILILMEMQMFMTMICHLKFIDQIFTNQIDFIVLAMGLAKWLYYTLYEIYPSFFTLLDMQHFHFYFHAFLHTFYVGYSSHGLLVFSFLQCFFFFLFKYIMYTWYLKRQSIALSFHCNFKIKSLVHPSHHQIQIIT